MNYRWGYSPLLIPFLGYAISFNDLSEQAYRVSEEIIQSQERLNTIGYEKNSFFSSEPINIETSARNIRADDRVGSGIEYGVMVDYRFKAPSLRTAQEHQFDLQKRGVVSEVEIQKSLLQIDLKHDWLLYRIEQERIGIVTEKRNFADKAYRDGELKFKAGRLSKMELLRLKSEYDSTLHEVSMAHMEAEHAQHRLKERVMSTNEVVIEDMNFSYIHPENLAEWINTSPSIISIDRAIEAIDAHISTLRNSKIESLSLGVGMTQEPTQNSVDLRVTFPLALSGKNENKMSALMSERSSMVHTRDVMREKLRITLSSLVEHLEERQNRIVTLSESEKHYESLFGMAKKGYEGGVVSQFEYLATKNDYFASRLRTLELKQSYIDEMRIIEQKLGRILK